MRSQLVSSAGLDCRFIYILKKQSGQNQGLL